MIANYPFFSLTCFFILICYVSIILYKIKVKIFYKNNSYRKIKLNEHPLYLMYPFEKKIYIYMYILYILGIILFTAGLFLFFSNSDIISNGIQFGIALQGLATIINVCIVINYFRLLKKERFSIRQWSNSHPSEKNKFIVIPSKITIYKKTSLISLLFSEIFLIISLITEFFNLVY